MLSQQNKKTNLENQGKKEEHQEESYRDEKGVLRKRKDNKSKTDFPHDLNNPGSKSK